MRLKNVLLCGMILVGCIGLSACATSEIEDQVTDVEQTEEVTSEQEETTTSEVTTEEETTEGTTEQTTEEEQSITEETGGSAEQEVIDPLELAGLYQGTCEGASLDISIYTSPEDGSIGSAFLAIAPRDGFISDTASGEIKKIGIDNTYEIDNERGYTIILRFYYSDDTLACEVLLDGNPMDTYYMVEHYRS